MPVRTDVPVLMLFGTFNPYTMAPDPASLATMSHAFAYVFPTRSSRPLDVPCAVRIRGAFVDDPTAQPNTGCIATLHDPTLV